VKSNFFSSGIFTLNRGKGTTSPFAGALLLATAFLFACSTIATYDQAAYEHAVNAKVDTLALVGKATEPYASNVKGIEALNLELNKAYEYDKGRPLNQKTLQLWEQLLVEKTDDPDSGIYPRFLHIWQRQGTISSAAVTGKQQRIALAFDEIIGLESGKNK
jgi:hypothetical protein